MYQYPKHIIPHYLNKHIQPEHIPHHACFVRLLNIVKKTPSNENEIHDYCDQYVKANEFIEGMSVYLLDTYRPRHSRFKINKEAEWLNGSWENGYCKCPKENEYRCEDDICYVLIPTKLIKHASFDVEKFIKESFSNDKDLFDKDIIIESLKKITLRYEHAPTLCNFWHFNIFMYDVNGVKIDSNYLVPKKIERVARSIKKAENFKNIFSVPGRLHKCRISKKYYMKANTKYYRQTNKQSMGQQKQLTPTVSRR